MKNEMKKKPKAKIYSKAYTSLIGVMLSAQSFPQIVTFSNTESPDLVNIGFLGTGQDFAILG